MTFRSWGDLSRGRLAAFAACQYRHPSGNNSSLHVLCPSGTGALDAEGFVTRHGRGVWTYDVVGDIPGLGATTSLDIRRRGPKGPCCNSGRCKTCKPRECRDLGGTGNGRGGFLGDPGGRKGRSKPAHNHRWFGARRAWIIHHEPRGVRVGRLDPAWPRHEDRAYDRPCAPHDTGSMMGKRDQRCGCRSIGECQGKSSPFRAVGPSPHP